MSLGTHVRLCLARTPRRVYASRDRSVDPDAPAAPPPAARGAAAREGPA